MSILECNNCRSTIIGMNAKASRPHIEYGNSRMNAHIYSAFTRDKDSNTYNNKLSVIIVCNNILKYAHLCTINGDT